MKTWKKILLIGSAVVAYVGYLIDGAQYHDKIIQNHIALATQKADVNNDGGIDVDEMMDVYGALGLSGEEIFKKLDREEKERIFKASFETISERREYLGKYLEEKMDDIELGVPRFSSDLLDGFVKELIDRDKDGNISGHEMYRVFTLLYGAGHIMKPFEKNHPILTQGNLLTVLVIPHSIHKGSQLERYVNSEYYPTQE